MPSPRRVFLHVCHGSESDPAPRRLQLKDTVRFRNISRTLGGHGALYWRHARVDEEASPADVGMRGTLAHPEKLVFVPIAVTAPHVQYAPPRVDTEARGGKAKLMSPDPRILLAAHTTPSTACVQPVAAPARLISPSLPVHVLRGGPTEPAPAAPAPAPPLSYPSEAVMYTPQSLWSHAAAARAGPSTASVGQHRYGVGTDVGRAPVPPHAPPPPRRNVPILQPPGLADAAAPDDGDGRWRQRPVHAPDTELLRALHEEVRALRGELDAVRASRAPSTRDHRSSSASARRLPSPSPPPVHASALPRGGARRRWTSPLSPSARNPYVVDELADDLHHAQLLRLAELRYLDFNE